MYVTQYFGRPLEKLNVFFEGIQQLVAAGVKESEISYQLAYSKQGRGGRGYRQKWKR